MRPLLKHFVNNLQSRSSVDELEGTVGMFIVNATSMRKKSKYPVPYVGGKPIEKLVVDFCTGDGDFL